MKILFDLYTPQLQIGGSGEYVRRIFYALLEYVNINHLDAKIVAMLDFSRNSLGDSEKFPSLEGLKRIGVECVDLSKKSLGEIIRFYKIDKVFIGCAQFFSKFDVNSLSCPVICVIHDLNDQELYHNKINDLVRLETINKFTRYKISGLIHKKQQISRLDAILNQTQSNTEFKIITVSQYSKMSLLYNFDYVLNNIDVLYSPERILRESNIIENAQLRTLIQQRKKYFILLSANRVMKNAKNAMNAFQRYVEHTKEDVYIATTGLKEKMFDRHIPLPYLSDEDLTNSIRHCYALLFPSLFEGFGYPPLEAMKFGKPVLSSNVTSMPEILGDAPIYFSPFYQSDIFSAFLKLKNGDYNYYVNKSKERYHIMHKKQEEHLNVLLNLLVSSTTI